VLLVSHHIQLCLPAVKYVAVLENGRVTFAGPPDRFQGTTALTIIEQTMDGRVDSNAGGPASRDPPSTTVNEAPKLADEKREIGRISAEVWRAYMSGFGGRLYWFIFALAVTVAAYGPVLENGWLK
jgi:energy-coupling factor transporter ATP-binding protein EcfA2